MAIIKNLHLLNDILSEKDLDKMELAGTMHKRHSNITFKIVEVNQLKVTIQAVQEKNAGGNYFDMKRLVEIVNETFGRFFPKMKILVHPIPYEVSPANDVDSDWIKKRMLDHGIKLKEISRETGIDNTQLSSLVSGDRSLSQPMKALFYYYFYSKGAK